MESLIHHDIQAYHGKLLAQICYLYITKSTFLLQTIIASSQQSRSQKAYQADNLILAYEVMFSIYGLPKNIMLDAGGNFISEKLIELC